jgi:hypothetical protein
MISEEHLSDSMIEVWFEDGEQVPLARVF